MNEDEPPGGVAVAWPPDTSGGGEAIPGPSPPPAVEYVSPFDAPMSDGVKAGMGKSAMLLRCSYSTVLSVSGAEIHIEPNIL